MIKRIAILIMIAGAIFAGTPRTWDVRFGDSSTIAKDQSYDIYTQSGDTTDLMPRFFDRGRAMTISSNALVRAYFREYGSTNSFVASSSTGTVYTTASDKGRVKITVYDSDYAATTNEFFVGVDIGGYIYSAKGSLTVLDGPGINPTTNSNGRITIDWNSVDNVNTTNAPFVTKPIESNIKATLISNSVYTISILTD